MINNLWIIIGAMLVFLMHLGFSMLESGLCRIKNCTNILFKNTLTPAIGFLAFALCGFSLMFPTESHWVVNEVLTFSGFGVHVPGGDPMAYNGTCTFLTFFLFQGMFAATTATIVSGAVAERVKLSSYLIFTLFYVALVYPILGSWGWGGGWLASLNFHDFAGSTFVHSIGGWGALAGVIMLGPRIGKYVKGEPKALPGHNMPIAVIGTFCLWLGWFGFNGASALNADPATISYVLVTTMLAASAGVIGSMFSSLVFIKKPDLSMILNGCLAGLVAITAGTDCIGLMSSIVVGLIAGVIVVPAVLVFDRLHLDDPVGALSVHLVNGIWGTLAVGIFTKEYSFGTQLLGVVTIGAASFASALFLFWAIKKVFGLRVSEEEEMRGLDISEHGMEAYPGFQFFSNQ